VKNVGTAAVTPNHFNSITGAALACFGPCFVALKISLIYCILTQPISRVYIPVLAAPYYSDARHPQHPQNGFWLGVGWAKSVEFSEVK
jgi:hypothetical protein